ncbi:MAG: hypothetical protein EP343_33515 [Deltaproteobacteria bacterium]|nr:MAG: hypothetical protein EP343_33515 [Deltaproteobacteria bacterium]
MKRWGLWQVRLDVVWSGHEDRGLALPLSATSTELAELWIPRATKGESLLRDKRLQGQFPSLEAMMEVIETPGPPNEPVACEVDPVQLQDDWQRLVTVLKQVHAWPPRYWFSPEMDYPGPAPRFSRRKLDTGQMEAGYNLCYINRNWDGIDRLDDLTDRHAFEDALGTLTIQRQPMWDYLGQAMQKWLHLLTRGALKEAIVTWERLGEEPETFLEQVMYRAESWRHRTDMANYHPNHLEQVAEQWEKLLQTPGVTLKMGLDLGAYVAEVMRAQWGGTYRPYKPKESKEKIPDRVPTRRRKKAPEVPDFDPDVELVLPFGRTIHPMRKALQAMQEKRKLAWKLQVDVLDAHRRQGQLIDHLGQELFSEDTLRVRGVLRLLWDIADLRVEEWFAQRLMVEDDPLHLCMLLERMEQAPKRVPVRLLGSLVQESDDAVSARALWLLFHRQEPQLPDLIEQNFVAGERTAVRPLLRHILTHWKKDPSRARRVLRGLGPIPPQSSPEDLFPPVPGLWEPLPLLAEILEDCANPAKHEVALQMLQAWPNLSEEDTLGSALADPDPVQRAKTIGLLSSSDRRELRALLRTRMMFETDDLCRRLLQAVLSPQPSTSTSASTI